METREDLLAQAALVREQKAAKRRAAFLAWRDAHPQEYQAQLAEEAARAAHPESRETSAIYAQLVATTESQWLFDRRWSDARTAQRAKARQQAAERATPEGRARAETGAAARLERFKKVMELRWQGRTFKAIGQVVGSLTHDGAASTERVRQIYEQGLRRLRHPRHADARAVYEQTGRYTLV